MDRPEAHAFDVVVVGFGVAGAAAAIEAHDQGAEVLILEATPRGGGSVLAAAGSIATIVDRDDAIAHYHLLTQGRTPRELLEVYVDGLRRLPEWIRNNGGRLTDFELPLPHFPRGELGSAYPGLPHSDAIGRRLQVSVDSDEIDSDSLDAGALLWAFIERAVDQRRIQVRTNARVIELLQDENRRVVGCTYVAGGSETRVTARRGMCLTSGGFSHHRSLLRDTLGVEIESLAPLGGASGDGIRMAQKAGAGTWHMNGVVAAYGYRLPDRIGPCVARLSTYGFFVVDQLARRYANEMELEGHTAGLTMLATDPATGRHVRAPSYLIFDEAARQAGPIGFHSKYAWSTDNSAEIAQGYIKRSESLEDLALSVGLEPAALLRTAQMYNRVAMQDGIDYFGRSAQQSLPVATPPFYAIAIHPVAFGTLGGPIRDSEARVLDPYGAPIGGLFSAGELGSMWSSLYPGAGLIGEALVYGRIAGRNAARMNQACNPPYPSHSP